MSGAWMIAQAPWLAEFRAFTGFHAAVLVICAALVGGAIVLGLRWRGTPREERLGRIWGLTVLAFQPVAMLYWLWIGGWRVYPDLPLHVCDLSAIIAGVAMVSGARWSRTVLYFWGFGLATQAFVTPTVTVGVFGAHFWLFWINHVQIVGSAAYDLVVRRYRPDWRDFAMAFVISQAYTAAMLAYNTALGTNYGFVGPAKPDTPTVVDALGQWPLRVVIISCAVATLFAAMWLVWPISRWLSARLAPGRAMDR